ncbi:Pycsar system effector family protein [Nocardia sp. GTS18]|uniref:Pycsar system effector family protein n=1 Tax=Nocardia sp. GTS18 TaxID=1778064 RepID=UPI0015EE97D3|nr:Pycsar system effector family protein [Nocardia sp. GTS18]
MFKSCRLRGNRAVTDQDDDVAPALNPDHAWKTLGLVNEWIRHADAKAGVTLAFTGVLATMVFNLVKDFDRRSTIFDLLVVLACALLLLTGALCGWTLTPRVNDSDADPQAINLLYFGSISHHFKGRRQQFSDVLSTLTSDDSELIRHLSAQVHANAKIATTKARSAKWAIRSALATGVVVAALAITVGVSNS